MKEWWDSEKFDIDLLFRFNHESFQSRILSINELEIYYFNAVYLQKRYPFKDISFNFRVSIIYNHLAKNTNELTFKNDSPDIIWQQFQKIILKVLSWLRRGTRMTICNQIFEKQHTILTVKTQI